jgi:hypothetical protein
MTPIILKQRADLSRAVWLPVPWKCPFELPAGQSLRCAYIKETGGPSKKFPPFSDFSRRE